MSQPMPMPQTVLLIQEDPADAQVIRYGLTTDEAFEVEWARCCAEGVERLTAAAKGNTTDAGIAAVLVDLSVPDSQGIATIDFLFRTAPQIPILVLCDTANEELAKLALQHGAQDYLLKERLDGYLVQKILTNAIDHAATVEALFAEKERAQITLNCISDAVISTDMQGQVTALNGVAEKMTGWSSDEAAGRPLEAVFRIVDAVTREAVQSPLALAVRENKTASLPSHCLLIRRDGVKRLSKIPLHRRTTAADK